MLWSAPCRPRELQQMFNNYVYDENFKKPTDSIYYLIAENGKFKAVNNDYYEATIPEDESTLRKCKPAARMKLPPLPYKLFQEVDAFFAAIYKQHDGEAIVLLAASPVDKAWAIVVPEQVTNGLHVDYKIPDKLDLPEHYRIFGSIHSHASISAFHSGTDTSDERHSDGLHAVIGHYNLDVHDTCASLVIQGHRFELKQQDWLETPQLPPVEASSDWVSKVTKKKYEERSWDSVFSASDAVDGLFKRREFSSYKADCITQGVIESAREDALPVECFSTLQNQVCNLAMEALVESLC